MNKRQNHRFWRLISFRFPTLLSDGELIADGEEHG